MKIQVVRGGIQDATADTLILNLFEGVTSPDGATGALDRALDGAISDLIAGGDFSGKPGEVAVLYPHGTIPARRVLVTGLGKPGKFDLETIRKSAAVAIKKARDLNAKDVASIVFGSGIGGVAVADAAQATAEGLLLALYRFPAPKQKQESNKEIQSVTLVEIDDQKIAEIEAGVRKAEIICEGVNLARELVSLPPNMATPTRLAQAAEEIAAQFNMGLTIGDRDWAAERGMGAFLAVAKGAGEPPKFIVLEYNRERDDLEPVVLVGKGITFDTGGISIKPADKMEEMKSDMAGAAAVLATMKVVGTLGLPLRVIGIAPCTENMPDANAYRPADIVTASNGKSIEIVNTDAEGRLVLADALVYAQQYHPKAVVDLATLTGACVVALGDGVSAGLFYTDESLKDRLLASSERTNERVWPLPLWDDYSDKIKSDYADIKNSAGRFSGVGSSAAFLKEFTDYPWAHLDIAAMALANKESAYTPVGGTGYGVRLLVDLLLNW